MDDADDSRDALRALSAFETGRARARRVSTGLINETWRIDAASGRSYALQSLNPIFPAQVNENIERVTGHLAAQGLLTPRLVRTREGDLWHEDAGRVWRLMTWIEGRSLSILGDPAQAREAGRLLGGFHAALADFTRPFACQRSGVHDTARHLASLREALDRHGNHPAYDQVAPLATEILRRAETLPATGSLPERVVHGDPKINNVVFDQRESTALCLVDLDTVARMPLHLELGDAFRSWCNPRGEDLTVARFELAFLSAGLEGYATSMAGIVQADEVASIVPGIATIILELSARFCADALEESYFGWDETRFPSRGEHNRVRAAGQLALYDTFLAARAEAERAVARVFPGS